MNVVDIEQKKKSTLQTLGIIYTNGNKETIVVDFYGVIEGMTSFLAFYKDASNTDTDVPFKLININNIVSITRLDNKND